MIVSEYPISVVLCTYNGEKFIKSQILSILTSLNQNDQVIISDDCSTDNTLDIVYSIKDDRISVYVNKSNLGYSANFLRALSLAHNNYIFLADQDDIHSPIAFSEVCRSLSSGCDLYIGSMLLANAKATPYAYLGFPKDCKIYHWNLIHRLLLLSMLFLGKSNAFGCAMAFKRNSFTKLIEKPFSEESPPHDLLIYAYSLLSLKTIFLSSCVHLCHRIHPNNTSPLVSKRSVTTKLEQRFRLAKILTSLLFC